MGFFEILHEHQLEAARSQLERAKRDGSTRYIAMRERELSWCQNQVEKDRHDELINAIKNNK